MASPFPQLLSPSSPAASSGGVDTIFASAALAASGAWTRSSVISVARMRKLTLFVDYDPGAIGGYPGVIPLGSNGTVDDPNSQPAAGDDSWFVLSNFDGSITSGVASGTLPTGADYTIVQPMGSSIAYATVIRLTAATNATDEYRQAITIDVTPFRWFHFIAAEQGVTATPGTLSVTYSLSL